MSFAVDQAPRQRTRRPREAFGALQPKIRKHALAESDLIGIWQYTFEQWGAALADRYLDELDDGINHSTASGPDATGERGRHLR